MKRTQAFALLAAGGLILPALVRPAPAANNPYGSITSRNPFALVAPPPDAPPPPETPPANLKLTGISTLFGDKRAMLMVQDTSGPGKPDLSVILREGQREGSVEVIEINEKIGWVKVKNNDKVSVLTFDANGIKAAPAPAAPPLLPPPAIQPSSIPQPGVPNPTQTSIEQPRPRGGLRQIPTRTLRLPQGGAAGGVAGGQAAENQSAVPQGNFSAEDHLVLMHAEQILDTANPPKTSTGTVRPQVPLPPLAPGTVLE